MSTPAAPVDAPTATVGDAPRPSFNALQDAPVSVRLRRTPPPAAVRRRSRRRRPIRPCSTTSRRPGCANHDADRDPYEEAQHRRQQDTGSVARGGKGFSAGAPMGACQAISWLRVTYGTNRRGRGSRFPCGFAVAGKTARQAGSAGMGGTALEPVTPSLSTRSGVRAGSSGFAQAQMSGT